MDLTDSLELADSIRQATAQLTAAGVPSPRIDAELLAGHLLGLSPGELRAAALRGVATPVGYSELIAERAKRLPLQHLTGKAYFRQLELAVGPGVFVPRPETESVAQLAIDQALLLDAAVVVDLGTGSGALAAAIASEVTGSKVYAVELSELAHAWAAQNLAGHSVELRLGDLRTAFPELNGQVDVVVSNPPYIPADAVPNEPEVAEHDPEIALYGGGIDGLELPAAALVSAARLLKPGGYFVMEHAEVQAAAIQRLFQQAGFTQVQGHRDLAGKDRATSGQSSVDQQTSGHDERMTQ
ncbi:peptide chain release factor N(5)-glutamine methyltransferase [Psychromicrobium lacuslunae]|uniref:Release factor glutamine methyltransferase n=1 Tax=Psychromicrobium lacuslunae TaxID=1618207 RepID=A0A0D4BY08_9MICC|nr:peptide chain release factor N(5)-glutamine methyltransferase [Psychromicrobium lacuslunae]AJT41352.1 SAM-dependent methyltransferase [Psychromicrobium lacuslunae]